MRYRTKIILILVAVALLTNGTAMSYMYLKSKGYLFQQIQTTVHSIASTAATGINGESLQQLKPGDETTDKYKTLATHLRKLRNANRRDDVFVKYIYTVHTSKARANERVFGVDPEEDPKNRSHIGDPVPNKGVFSDPFRPDASMVENRFTSDQWGEWITAKAPILDHSGNPVASLGVDVAANDVRMKLNTLLYAGLISVIGSVILAVIVSLSIARRVTKPLYVMRDAVEHIGEGNLDTKVAIQSQDEFGKVAIAINNMVDGLKEKGVMQKLFARYVSADVAAKLMASGEMPEASGVRKHVTVLFSDIRGFTQLSDKMPPEEVVECLNEYFECMIPVISRNHGTLDKFMGDGIMVHFGAIRDDPQQEEHAVNAALEMQTALADLGDRWAARERQRIAIGVGINSGVAVVGNVGASTRMEYTIIGDTVNLAARLEPLTKELDVPIIISEYTYVSVKNRFRTAYLGEREIRGRADTVRLYSVVGGEHP